VPLLGPSQAHPTTQVVTNYDHCLANRTSSSLTDDCLLASTWDYAGTTRHAIPRRRTPTTSFQHLWRKHRSTAREASPRRHCLNIMWPACWTTSTIRLSLFTPPSVPSSSSPSPYTWNMRSGRHVCFPARFNP
jgi:hypothetical protein